MRTHWHRLASAAVATGCILAFWQMSALSAARGGSLLLLIVMYSTAVIGAIAVSLTVGPHTVWERISGPGTRWLTHLGDTTLLDRRRTGRWFAATGVCIYVILLAAVMPLGRRPLDDDQAAFLQTAGEVRDAGGPLALVQALYAGEFEEANRHPLYIGLLSIHPSWSFGRWLSAGIGLATLLLLTWLVLRSCGSLVAGVFCLLLGTNAAFSTFSTRVVCEVLMVLWGGLAYLLSQQRTRKRAVLLGGVLALAWLTKGTGLVLLGGTATWFLLAGLQDFRRRRRATSTTDSMPARNTAGHLLAMLAVWAVVASPLLVRNSVRYGSPFYNVNSYLLFVDRYEDPVALARQQTIGDAAREYFESHAPLDMVRREVTGLVWETFILLRMLGPAFLDDARMLLGVPLVLCAVLAVLARPRGEHGMLACWLALCLPLFAWYIPVAAGERFPLPLLAPVLMLAAEGLVRLARTRIERGRQSPPNQADRPANLPGSSVPGGPTPDPAA